MTELLDRHCPVVTVRRRVRPLTSDTVVPRRVRPLTPWFDADCRAARRRARAAESRYRRLRRRPDVDKRDWKTKYSLYEDTGLSK